MVTRSCRSSQSRRTRLHRAGENDAQPSGGGSPMLGGTAGKKIARGVLGGILGYGTGRER
jgi:hypothetical protein